jgi:hypothetical protein
MNQPTKYWAASLIIDASALSMFYLWQVEGVDRAGAVFQFGVWAITLMTALSAFSITRKHVAENPRPKGFAAYHFCSEVALIVALVWVGFVMLAAFRLFAVLLFESALIAATKDA